jgi:hypothetical protein
MASEIEKFQRDLLRSVQQARAGNAASVTRVKAPGASEARAEQSGSVGTEPTDALDECHMARKQQRQVELRRLDAHERIGIELLTQPSRRRVLLTAARREIQRWEDSALCSSDYIARWREWLALPLAELVPLMCSDAQGWGPAMRQNSPFVTYRATYPS